MSAFLECNNAALFLPFLGGDQLLKSKFDFLLMPRSVFCVCERKKIKV